MTLSRSFDHLRPSIFSIEGLRANNVVSYAQQFSIVFMVPQPFSQIIDLRRGVMVSLVAPSFTTHSFAMNQRLLELEIIEVQLMSMIANIITVYVPPTVNLAPLDTKLGSLKVLPDSLPIFSVVFIMILALLDDHFIIPFARRVTKSEMGISHLQRIGIGLIMSIVAMAIAALVEIKCKNVANDSGLDSTKPLPLTFFWIAFQYLFLGSADLFTLAGLLEFFFIEAPSSMRSLATSLSWTSLAMGYYLSSFIVLIVNSVTRDSNNKAWLSGENLNHYRLDLFYWLMCGLSTLNFLHYLFWAIRYKYNRATRG